MKRLPFDPDDRGMRSIPPAARASILTVVALVTTAGGVAEAKTHRFMPSQEVEVSFELRGPAPRGVLVRFVRNDLALVRSRSGAMVLERQGSRSRRLTDSRRGARRVSVALSTRDGRATLALAGHKTRLASSFVADHAVAVRAGRSLSAVKVRTGEPPAEGAKAPGSSPIRGKAPAVTGCKAELSAVEDAVFA